MISTINKDRYKIVWLVMIPIIIFFLPDACLEK